MQIETIDTNRSEPIIILPKCKRQMSGMSDNCTLCEHNNQFYKDCRMRGNK